MEYTQDRVWVFRGLWISLRIDTRSVGDCIRGTGTGSVVDRTVYVGLVLGLYWTGKHTSV